MLFSYRVKDMNGTIKKGKLVAENKNLMIQNLLKQNYVVLDVKEEKEQGKNIELKFTFLESVPLKDLMVFTRQLATMIAAGLPIIRCFNILQDQTRNPKLKRITGEIKDDLEGGMALWEAIEKHEDLFSSMFVSMIRAGEAGGVLDVVLEKLADHQERDQEIRSKVKSASTYPVIMLAVALLVITFILTFVLPTFTDMFGGKENMPAFTLFFLNISGFIKSYGLFILIGIIALYFAGTAWGKKPSGRLFFDSLYLKLPLLGKTINRVAVARFTRVMGVLISSGVPILQSLEVLKGVVGNQVIANAIAKSKESIKEGQSIAAPLEETGVFEPMVTQMIAIGEETGRLDEMLGRMADFYDREVTYAIESTMAALEPILLIFVAVIVGMIVIATYLPVFSVVMNM